MEAPKFWEPVRSVHLRWAETGPGLAQWRRRTCSLQAGQDRSSFLLSARGRRRDAPTGVCVHAATPASPLPATVQCSGETDGSILILLRDRKVFRASVPPVASGHH